MNKSTLTFQDMLQIVELIRDSSSFSELRIRSGELEIDLRRDTMPAGIARPTPDIPPQSTPAVPPSLQQSSKAPAAAETDAPTSAAPTTSIPVASSPPSSEPKRDGPGVIRAPMVGTVYRAPEPSVPPFVAAGQTVDAGDQLAIIEVMKLMNPIRTEHAGIVSEILFADGDVVEYGQALFVVTPRG